MAYHELLTRYATIGVTIASTGLLLWSDRRIQKKFEAKITKTEKKLFKGIQRAQFVATGSALMTIDDGKELPLMQQKLQVFLACMQTGAGGENCIKVAMEEEEGKGKGAE